MNIGWWAITFVIILLAAVVVVLLGCIPGIIARRRGHENALAIRICGMVGILIWPCWIVALIWAYTGPDRRPAPGRVAPVSAAQRILNKAKHRVRTG
jgi:ABC-type dipeptide/oligopeptide/nickel transport system permease component